MATKSEISCSVTVPAMSKRMLKMPCGTSSSSEFNSTVALEGYQIPTKPVKQYDEVSCCSYTTAIDHGMKSNNFRSGSGEKPSYKTIHQIMQKEELGSLEISCTSGKGHEEVVGSICQEESAEVEVLDNSVLGLVLNEQPESGIKHSIEEEPAEVEGLEDFVLGLVSNEQPNSGIKHSIDDPETCIDFAFDPCEEVNEQRNNGQFTSLISAVQCQSPDDSLCNATEYAEAKDSFGATRVGGNSTGSVHKSSTYYRGSTGSDVSDESILSIGSGAMNKPHQANDTRWEAIQTVRSRNNGTLGLNNFRLLRKLGCGDIGSVYLSELIGFKVHYAMKIMDKAALQSRKKLPRAQTEREILQCLDHPFLPTLYAHFETEKFSCLVMEFCPGGDLHALRQRQPGKHFSEHAARFYVAEVLLALEYLHMLGIIYRDLKPENVLVRDDGHIMLSDFDLSLRCAVSPTLVRSSNANIDPSKQNSSYCVQPACVIESSCLKPSCFGPRFSSSKSKKEKKTKPWNEINSNARPLPELIAEPTNARSMSFVGTHEYLAPEIIKGEGHGSAVDWWTLGIFLYELLYGKTPFKGSGNRATLFNVVGEPLRFPDSFSVSFAAKDLIRGLLVKEPQHRLAYRRGATEIKRHPFFQSINWALIRCTKPPEVPKPFIIKFPETNEMHTAPKTLNSPAVDMNPSGNHVEIEFF